MTETHSIMSISKLRSRPAILKRQEHVRSPNGGGGSGVSRTNIADAHKTAKSITPAAITKQLNTAPTNAAAVTTAHTLMVKQQQQSQLPQATQTYIPQTSLLKIEPFVPSLTTRLRHPFGRSYTTLSTTTPKAATASSNNNHKRKIPANTNAATALNSPLLGAAIDSNHVKANATTTRATLAVHLRRNPVRAIVTRQRSKSTSATNQRPPKYRNLSPNMLLNSQHIAATHSASAVAGADAAGDGGPSVNSSASGNSNAAIVTLQPNGICRITRSSQEREKQPDRINYDRRGLSAIPIFEHETQLRLLSLQHNLINIFQIPKEEPPSPPPPPLVTSVPTIAPTDVQSEFGRSKQNALILANDLNLAKPLRRQSERVGAGKIDRSANGVNVRLTLALASTNARQLNSNTVTPPPPAPPPSPLGQIEPLPRPPPPHLYQQLLQQRLTTGASNNLIKNLQYNAPLLPLVRQPMPCRFALKRSKSFITNIPRHLSIIQQNLLKTQIARVKLSTTGAEARLKSFDSNTSALTNITESSSSTLEISTTNTIVTNKTSNSDGSTFAVSELEEDNPLQQLTVKNRQLVASYGMIFQDLVFLDLYDNQIERIGNLDGLPMLSVLLLGKNRLTDIGGLSSVRQTLRVLDLHGNKIANIANKLNCLQELKSLNLAGNLLRQIGPNDFSGLGQLRELNLKRNKIKRISGFEHLVALERLWLCHNELHRVDDMASIARATNLLEIAIENNPVSLAGDCVSFLVSHLPRLQSLSQMPITEQVRCAAMSWRRNKEISDTHYAHLSPDAYQSIKREEVISNARTNWELLRSQKSLQQHSFTQKHTQQRLTQAYPAAPRIAIPTELACINESTEVAGNTTEEGGLLVAEFVSELEEFIKVPPIQPQQQKHPEPQQQHELQQTLRQPQKPEQTTSTPTTTKPNAQQPHNLSSNAKCNKNKNNNVENSNNSSNSARNSGSSVSSLGPNIQSSSSCFSSDNEDSTELRQRATRIHKRQKAAGQQQRRSGTNEFGIENSVVKEKSSSAQNAKSTNSDAEMAIKANNEAERDEQRSNITTSTVTTGSELEANRITTKYANAMSPDIVNLSTQQASQANVKENITVKALESVSQVDNNSSILTPNRNSNASKTTLAQQKVATTTAIIGSTPTAQITSRGSSLSLGFKEHLCMPVQAPQQTTSSGNGGPTGHARAATRTVCRRLMRSQTIVGASGVGTNNCSPAAAINGNEVCSGKRTANTSSGSNNKSNNNNGKAIANATLTPCNGQAPTKPTVTCIVAPTPLSAANNSLLGGPRASTAGKGEREVREREREQGGDYLIEICGRYLNVYGQGALRYIDKQWNATKAQDVHTLNFSYINFNNIASTILARVKSRFPNVENFVFRETNIEYIGQLNALAELQGISSLTIDPEGNAITTKDLWREYAIYRLSHWGLKLINGVTVTEAEIETSNELYEGLSDLVLWAMPATMLQPLLARLRLDETCTASKMSPKEWLMKPENKSLRLVVGKEALQWKKPTPTNGTNNNGNVANTSGHHQQPMHYAVKEASVVVGVNPNTNFNALSMRERGRLHFATMLENTVNAMEKMRMLESLWSSMLLDIVRNALLDYSHLDEYLRNEMEEIMK
ncbi:uncharacterized protein LOC129242523 [Anastrepha obliqua]|uniref:uncharacterized protein LOC129242523 n=1 Tax=Anastrepha obliqua TaxID=95512 RepID=UPI0024094F44|nr:uncharacterized protein LOC129242523 [Anastrepha obliqua]